MMMERDQETKLKTTIWKSWEWEIYSLFWPRAYVILSCTGRAHWLPLDNSWFYQPHNICPRCSDPSLSHLSKWCYQPVTCSDQKLWCLWFSSLSCSRRCHFYLINHILNLSTFLHLYYYHSSHKHCHCLLAYLQ